MNYLMQENGFCKGIELKREPTWDETKYCLEEILGFNLDYMFEIDKPDEEWADEDEINDYNEEVAEEIKDIHKTFIDFIKGECTWHWLCDTLYCYDDLDEFTIGNFAYLIKYLDEKEII